MKILICTPEYPPKASGIGAVVKSVSEEFKKKGHECIICSPIGPNIKLGSQVFIEKFGGFGLIFFWEQVRKFFKNNSEHYDAVWLHHPLFIFKSPFNRALVTMHTTYYGYKILSKKLNYNFYNCLYYKLMEKIESFSLRRLYITNIFTYIDHQLLNEFSKIGLGKFKAIFISNGVNTTKLKPPSDRINLRNKYNTYIKDYQYIFLVVGRLTGQKRLFKLINVFSKVSNKIQNSSLFLVGKGELSNNLRKYVEDLNLTNVHFFGFVEEDKLLELYAISDYYIIASEYEGQPLTLLEAMSCGCPCIVSDIPNLNIVTDVNCGIAVDFSDEERTAQKIIDYIKKNNSIHARNARKYAEENLDWEIIAGNYLNELKELKRND